jgi:hypothetical protein
VAVQTQTRQVGDTRIAIAAQLKRPDGNVVATTGLTPKFAMYDSEDGTAKVAETTSNITVSDAANGKLQYDPQAADVDTEGLYYAYFILEDGTGKQDTFPAKKGDLRIDIQNVQ